MWTMLTLWKWKWKLFYFAKSKKLQGCEYAYQFFEQFTRFLLAKQQFAHVKELVVMSYLSKLLMVALLSWATWANSSRLLFHHERPEQIAHGYSFVMSNLSKSLTVALLFRATRANCSWFLFKISNFERKSEWANEQMSEFATLQKLPQKVTKNEIWYFWKLCSA